LPSKKRLEQPRNAERRVFAVQAAFLFASATGYLQRRLQFQAKTPNDGFYRKNTTAASGFKSANKAFSSK